MNLEIITPTQKIFAGEIKLIQLPGVKGSFEILKKHAPIVSILEKGKMRIVTHEGEETLFEIESGVVEASTNSVIVLTESVK